MTLFMLMFHSAVTPIICAATIEKPFWSVVVSFTVVFCYWSVLFIANELEMPYGDDPNDLPLYDLSVDMNKSLMCLLEPRARQAPEYILPKPGYHAPPSTLLVDLDSDLSITACVNPQAYDYAAFRPKVTLNGWSNSPTSHHPGLRDASHPDGPSPGQYRMGDRACTP